MKIIEQDYYVLVNYRGKEKYYHVPFSAQDGYVRLQYLDYNPNREWDGVWAKPIIIKKFDNNTEEYRYFNSLKNKWQELLEQEAEKDKKWYKLDYIPVIGTLNVLKCWKEALKMTPNPLGIKI